MFSHSGDLLVSCSRDGTIRLWNVLAGKCVAVLRVPQPYEGTNITDVQGLTRTQYASLLKLGALDITGAEGLTEAQRASMLALGAVEDL